MSLIARGQAMLVRALQGAAAVPGGVTYTRDAGKPTEQVLAGLTAWVGRTVFARTQPEPGAAVIIGQRDYLFAAADLVLGGAVVEPKRGDRITETVAGVPTTFELIPPAEDEPVWRYSDQTRTVLRVHVKRV